MFVAMLTFHKNKKRPKTNKTAYFVSFLLSYISGISILGMPAEIYTYGTQFWMVISSGVLVAVAMAIAYLPVFYKLQITSSYEVNNKQFKISDFISFKLHVMF